MENRNARVQLHMRTNWLIIYLSADESLYPFLHMAV